MRYFLALLCLWSLLGSAWAQSPASSDPAAATAAKLVSLTPAERVNLDRKTGRHTGARLVAALP